MKASRLSSLRDTTVNQNQPLTTTTASIPSLSDFIRKCYSQPIQHVVIGNKAGDSDSVISAITLAYVESLITTTTTIAMKRKDDKSGASAAAATQHDEEDTCMSGKMSSFLQVPIVSIPKLDLASQRPETTLLLKLAGISESVQNKLIFVDDPRIQASRSASSAAAASSSSSGMKGANVTLVDHNRLDSDFEPLEWKVRAILDHHLDEGYHTDTCLVRQVAFDNKKGHALVASTCSLIVERMQEDDSCAVFTTCQNNNNKYPADLSLLLLGVILLDSVNLNPAAGKVTPRDIAAVEYLLNNTSWDDLSIATQARLGMRTTQDNKNNHETDKPNTNLLFDALQSAKFDSNFWKGLSVRDALRLDYKRFEASSTSTPNKPAFGMSSVLVSLEHFLQNHGDDWPDRIHDFMQEKDVDSFVIMFASSLAPDEEEASLSSSSSSTPKLLKRQMMICGRDRNLVSRVVACLQQNDLLQLRAIDNTMAFSTIKVPIIFRCFEQQNAKASRKQVAPILLELFDERNNNLAPL